MEIVLCSRTTFAGRGMIEAIILIIGAYIIIAEIARRWRDAAERAKSRNSRA
jgi:hypothetical protein